MPEHYHCYFCCYLLTPRDRSPQSTSLGVKRGSSSLLPQLCHIPKADRDQKMILWSSQYESVNLVPRKSWGRGIWVKVRGCLPHKLWEESEEQLGLTVHKFHIPEETEDICILDCRVYKIKIKHIIKNNMISRSYQLDICKLGEKSFKMCLL